MKKFVLDLFHEQLVVQVEDGEGKIESGLERETCPSCGLPDCCFSWFSCDASQGADEEPEEDVAARLVYNGLLNGIEGLVLAHACAGIDIADPNYVQGVKAALEAAGNNL